MPGSNAPVEAIIGLGLDVHGRAWDDLNARMTKHVGDWRTVEGAVSRIGTHVDQLSSRLTQLGGAVGVAAVVADFVRLEDQANRVALAIGRVTGDQRGYLPIGQQLLAASRATGFSAPTLAGAVETLQMRTGGTYLARHGVQGTATALGGFAGAFNMDPGQLAAQVGTLELFQRQNPGSTPQLLAQLAAQARAAGMAGQTGLFTQTVSGATGALVSSHPSIAGPGVGMRVGSMYGAAQAANPAFRDPGTFGAGLQGVDQAVTGAYQNPRLQAMMQMAGIGYWEQRGGLGGPNGPAIARKILAWSAAQYGQGTIAQDMFLRSNFGGNVSADFLQSLAQGHATGQAVAHAGAHPGAGGDYGARAHQFGTTPGAAAQRGRSGIESELFGLFGNAGLDALNFVSHHPLESVAGAYGAKKLLGFGGRRLAAGLSARFAGREAAAAADEAIQQAAGRSAAWGSENLFRVGGEWATRAGGEAVLRGLGGAGARLGAGAIAGRALTSIGGSLAGSVAAAYAGFMLFPDSLANYNEPQALRNSLTNSRHSLMRSDVAAIERRYGKNWWTNPKAIAAARHGLGAINDPHQRALADRELGGALGTAAGGLLAGVGAAQLHVKGAGGNLMDGLSAIVGATNALGDGTAGGPVSSRKFDKAVDKFAAAVAVMFGHGLLGAAYHGGGPGNMNAAGLSGANDMIGSSMVLARAIGAGGGAGGGGGSGSSQSVAAMQFAALTGSTGSGGTGGGGTGGSGGTGPGNVAGGGWAPCTITWYDPALGGTNSSNGQKDPHARTASGEPYDAAKFTCAASSKYAFGTLIAIKSSKGTCTVKVNDRGGGVQGDHFDLSVAAWKVIGADHGQFKVVGSGGGGGGKHHSSGGGSHHLPPGVRAAKVSAGADAALAWQAGGGPSGTGGGGGGAATINVNVDGRRIDHYRQVTRSPV